MCSVALQLRLRSTEQLRHRSIEADKPAKDEVNSATVGYNYKISLFLK